MINPELNDAEILRQVDGQWQRIAMLLLHKLKGREAVTINAADMKAATEQFAPGIPVLMIHGHYDGFTLQVTDIESAQRLAAYNETMRGTG